MTLNRSVVNKKKSNHLRTSFEFKILESNIRFDKDRIQISKSALLEYILNFLWNSIEFFN